jgi:hypothetical protein
MEYTREAQDLHVLADTDDANAYAPEALLNALLDKLQLKHDAELARILKMEKRLLGDIRAGRLQISGSMLMQMQEASGIAIEELRRILGDRRRTSRMHHLQNRRF